MSRRNPTPGYTPRHWNGKIARSFPRADLPEPGMAVTAVAALLCGGLLVAIVVAAIAVCLVVTWPVY